MFFDLLGDVGNIGKGAYRFIDVLIYVLLHSRPPLRTPAGPSDPDQACIYAISTLAANSELTAAYASGVSILRLTGWLTSIGIVFAPLTAVIGEYVSPRLHPLKTLPFKPLRK